jgi:hypothetical protein
MRICSDTSVGVAVAARSSRDGSKRKGHCGARGGESPSERAVAMPSTRAFALPPLPPLHALCVCAAREPAQQRTAAPPHNNCLRPTHLDLRRVCGRGAGAAQTAEASGSGQRASGAEMVDELVRDAWLEGAVCHGAQHELAATKQKEIQRSTEAPPRGGNTQQACATQWTEIRVRKRERVLIRAPSHPSSPCIRRCLCFRRARLDSVRLIVLQT